MASSPRSARIAIGVIAGAVCALAVALKFRFGFDDSLDVVGVHLVGGLVGTLLIGFFGTTSVNALGADGLFYGGDATQLGKQAIAAFAVMGYSFVVTLILGLADQVHHRLPGQRRGRGRGHRRERARRVRVRLLEPADRRWRAGHAPAGRRHGAGRGARPRDRGSSAGATAGKES